MARTIIVIILIFCAAPALAGHPGMTDLNPRQATPGIRLELIEIPLTGGEFAKKYKLRINDYPRGLIFSVYTKDFSDTFAEAFSGFRFDDTGNMVSTSGGKQQRLQNFVLTPGPYPRGAVWDVAMATADRSVAAFAHIIPHPIAAQADGCSVSLELLSVRGDRFLVTGSGFAPNEDAFTELKIEGRIQQKNRRVSADGQLPRHVISHAAIRNDRTAHYSVIGRSCKVTIDYVWGERALVRQ